MTMQAAIATGLRRAAVALVLAALMDASGSAAPQDPPPPPPPDRIFRALDKDGDGRLSPVEIREASASLQALDADGDGSLGRDELFPPRRGRRPEGPPGRDPAPIREPEEPLAAITPDRKWRGEDPAPVPGGPRPRPPRPRPAGRPRRRCPGRDSGGLPGCLQQGDAGGRRDAGASRPRPAEQGRADGGPRPLRDLERPDRPGLEPLPIRPRPGRDLALGRPPPATPSSRTACSGPSS